MKIDFIYEPELGFGTDKHIDIRFGLMNYGPFDFSSELAPKQINLGIVGTPETIGGVVDWLGACQSGLSAKKSNQPNLFPRFPGYGEDTNLRAAIITDPRLQQTISPDEITGLCKGRRTDKAVEAAVDTFIRELKRLDEKPTVQVLVCAVPMNLLEFMDQDGAGQIKLDSEDVDDDAGDEERNAVYGVDFHHLLKARGMELKKPTQIILPMTYDDTKKQRQKRNASKTRRLQDEATRAWNLYTALYYKAGGIPWRLIRDSKQPSVCYVGVSFYKSLDGSKLMTSTAQIFNERGEGVILRGGVAEVSADDKQPHLQGRDASSLLERALDAYRGEHYNFPARVVIHKTSGYTPEELDGFKQALKQRQIDFVDFINIRKSYTRLFRNGEYPTLRGTMLSLDHRSHLLYTRGGVDFFKTYPGMYVPRPLEFLCHETQQTPRFLAQEILGLTKLNWNNTQFDNADPIIVKAARRVGDVLKYLGEEDPVQSRYAYYM
jgi:hypothetical protein